MSSEISVIPGDFRSFLAWEAAAQDTIDFKRIYVDMLGDTLAGLMLAQFLYWRLPTKRKDRDSKLSIERDGRLWLAKKDEEWWEDARLTPAQARSARLLIESQGIWTCRTFKCVYYKNLAVTHISLNEDVFLERLHEVLNVPEEIRNRGPLAKVKRIRAKNPGTKPNSGNRRRSESDVGTATGQETPEGEGGQAQAGDGGHDLRITNPTICNSQIVGFVDDKSDDLRVADPSICDSQIPSSLYIDLPSETFSETTIITGVQEGENSSCASDDDGGAADAEKTEAPGTPPELEGGEDSLLSRSDRDQVEGTKLDQPTDPGKVPGGPGVPRPALLALQPIPQGELESRPRRDPEGMKQLRALLYCSHRDRVADLHVKLSRATAVARIPRDLFTRLTDAEIQSAVEAARHDMPLDTKKRPFEVLAVLGLERLIGEPLTEEMVTGQPVTPTPSTAPRVRTPLPDDPEPEVDRIEVGSRWEHKYQDDKIVTVVAFDGPSVELHNGEKIKSFLFAKDYKRVH